MFLSHKNQTDNQLDAFDSDPLCDALKVNTTLTRLNLEGECKRNRLVFNSPDVEQRTELVGKHWVSHWRETPHSLNSI